MVNIQARTVIKQELLRLTIKKRGWLAAFGAVIILLSGTLLPLEYLKIGGIPLFFSGLILIAIGYLPYRQLQILETKPDMIEYNGQDFVWIKKGKPVLKIPEESIEKVEYVEKKMLYGLAIWLKKPVPKKVSILEKRIAFTSFENSDLFLPYFTRSALKALFE